MRIHHCFTTRDSLGSSLNPEAISAFPASLPTPAQLSGPPYTGLNLGDHVGDSPQQVSRNRHYLAAAIGIPADRFFFMDQQHTNAVQIVDSDSAQLSPAVDALVTANPGCALVVLVADCVPVLLADPLSGVIAAVHAGRRGAQDSILLHTLDVMCELGAQAENIQVYLGPSACGNCYEVPAEMAEAVETNLPGSYSQTSWGTSALDLRSGLARQARDRAVASIQIHPECTIEQEHYYSYRREGLTGRQAGVIWMSDANSTGIEGGDHV